MARSLIYEPLRGDRFDPSLHYLDFKKKIIDPSIVNLFDNDLNFTQVGNGYLVFGREESVRKLGNGIIWDNVMFDLDIYQPGTLADCQNEDNWGISSKGLDIGILWSLLKVKGERVRIGIVDTAVDFSHPTYETLIKNNWLIAVEAFDEFGIAVPKEKQVLSDYHGTFCSSILVGASTSGKLRGLCPNAELVSAGIVGSVASFKSAFKWIASQKCDVVSISLGIAGKQEFWASEILEIMASGAVTVIASGNEYWSTNKTRSPGNYPIPELISVGAISDDKKIWPKSGGEKIDWPDTVTSSDGTVHDSFFKNYQKIIVPTLCGPGVKIISASPGNGYYQSDGTSMATPHIAGFIALIYSYLRANGINNNLKKTAVKVLSESLIDLGDQGQDERYGFGIIDIDKFIKNILSVPL